MTGVVARLAKAFQEDPEQLTDIFATYFEEVAAMLAECHKAVAKRDLPALVRLGHGLKGSSANLRMQEVAASALQLEMAARGNDGALIGPALTALETAVGAAQNEVNEYYKIYVRA